VVWCITGVAGGQPLIVCCRTALSRGVGSAGRWVSNGGGCVLGVSRQTVQNWPRRYREGGLAGLADRSRRRTGARVHQTSAEVEVVICELRREHPR
jgi:Homeodomain-like domain